MEGPRFEEAKDRDPEDWVRVLRDIGYKNRDVALDILQKRCVQFKGSQESLEKYTRDLEDSLQKYLKDVQVNKDNYDAAIAASGIVYEDTLKSLSEAQIEFMDELRRATISNIDEMIRRTKEEFQPDMEKIQTILFRLKESGLSEKIIKSVENEILEIYANRVSSMQEEINQARHHQTMKNQPNLEEGSKRLEKSTEISFGDTMADVDALAEKHIKEHAERNMRIVDSALVFWGGIRFEGPSSLN